MFKLVSATLLVCAAVVAAAATVSDAAPLLRTARKRAVMSNASAAGFAIPGFTCGYDCTQVPGAPAPGKITHISQLRPCDVKVVGALGDSITAAYLAKSNPLSEERELSFSIGAGDGSENGGVVPTTFFNILKSINSNMGLPVYGGSPVSHIPELRGAPHDPLQDVCNVAQSEGRCEDLSAWGQKHAGGKGYQINAFIQELESLQSVGAINIATDWKVVNVFIVANDACSSCQNNRDDGTFFRQALNESIAELRRRVPKLFVNVMTSFPFGSRLLQLWKQAGLVCDLVHAVVTECSCLKPGQPQNAAAIDKTIQSYNEVIKDLASFWQAQNYSDFTVVAQTFAQNFVIPDINFVNPVDCFHPCVKSHRDMAVGLWDDVLTPISKKTYPFSIDMSITCPANDARFYSTG
jgi:phospholipase B1